MEDFQLDLIIGEGPAARSVKIDLAALHAGRRDDARRPAHQSAARPLRHPDPAQFLHRGGARADRQPRRPRARRRHDGGRRERDRSARARHAAHRRPAAAPAARLRPRSTRRRRSTARSPTAASRRSKSTPAASTPWTGAISRRSRSITAAARSASRPSPRRFGAARRHRGDHRAVSDPAGLHPAHPARPRCSPATPSAISASPSRAAIPRSSACSGRGTRSDALRACSSACALIRWAIGSIGDVEALCREHGLSFPPGQGHVACACKTSNRPARY